MTPRYQGPLPADLAACPAAVLSIMHQRVHDAIDAAYWAFTRTAKGAPPAAALYQRRKWITEALIRARGMEEAT